MWKAIVLLQVDRDVPQDLRAALRPRTCHSELYLCVIWPALPLKRTFSTASVNISTLTDEKAAGLFFVFKPINTLAVSRRHVITRLSFAWMLFICEIHRDLPLMSLSPSSCCWGYVLEMFGHVVTQDFFNHVVKYWNKKQTLCCRFLLTRFINEHCTDPSEHRNTVQQAHFIQNLQHLLCWLISLSGLSNLAVIQLNTFRLKMYQMFSVIILC